jgi:hypothetical protein
MRNMQTSICCQKNSQGINPSPKEKQTFFIIHQ